MTLKQTLLQINLVQDNEYLDSYCALIEANRKTKREKFKTQKHHIIPKYYFKQNNLPIDNTKNNYVNLIHKDHLLAHLYLFKCAKNNDYATANLASLIYVINGIYDNSNKTIQLTSENIEEIVNLIGETYSNLREELGMRLQQLNSKTTSTLGHIWIKNKELTKNKLILPEEADSYFKCGWSLGRLPVSDETKTKISTTLKQYFKDNPEVVKRNAAIHKNLIWVHNENEAKQISKEDILEYINKGWSLGRQKLTKSQKQRLSLAHLGLPSNVIGRKKIHKDGVMKTVKQEELTWYLKNGWLMGELPKSKEWLEKIRKANTKKDKK